MAKQHRDLEKLIEEMLSLLAVPSLPHRRLAVDLQHFAHEADAIIAQAVAQVDFTSPSIITFSTQTFHRAVKLKFVNRLRKVENRPLSSEGSLRYPGRYHLAGMPTIYFASDAVTVAKETELDHVFEPYAIFPIGISLSHVLDLTTNATALQCAIDKESLAQEWKLINRLGSPATFFR